MLHTISYSLLLCCFVISIDSLDIQILRFEPVVKPDKLWDLTKLKITRKSPGQYTFDGTMLLLQDLDDSIKIEVTSYYSRNGNGPFVLLPYRLPKQGYCAFLNGNYKKFMMHDMTNKSNWPVIDNEYFCPMRKGTYTMENVLWDPSNFTALLKVGYYKVNFEHELPSGDLSVIDLFIKVNSVLF